MRPLPVHISPDLWLKLIFSAKSAMHGGVVRRSVPWVESEIGRERMVAEVKRRGFHMIECGGQFVVICNGGGVRVIC